MSFLVQEKRLPLFPIIPVTPFTISGGLDGIVLENGITGARVAVVVLSSKCHFIIYSTRPCFPSQKPVKLMVNQEKFYAYANVKQTDKVLQVFMEAQQDDEEEETPECAIHCCRRRDAKYRHLIKHHDETVVASTRYSQHSYMLAICPKVDTFLMILLATIANQLDKTPPCKRHA